MTEPGTPSPVLPWEAPPEQAGPAPGIEFAGHGARLVAYLIDGVILTFVMGVLIVLAFVPMAGVDRDPVTRMIDLDTVSTGGVLVMAVLLILALLIAFFYFPFFWARGGQTPGMRMFGLHVVRDRDGSRVGWGSAILRLIGMYLASSVFYLGFIWIFIDKRRRGWHDLIAGTVVVKRS
jgi:uncharacterized RDD family membrane protein YckC